MPLPVIPKALYPFVPFAPGVPSLLRDGAKILDDLTFGQFGISNALSSIIGRNEPRWGIYDDEGNPVLVGMESIVSFEYSNTFRVSDYPLEEGKFSSYNKVADPFDIGMTATCGGTSADRTDFLNSLENAARSLALYTIVTPEATYSDANIVTQAYRRTAENGANKITAEIRCIEVRQVAAAAFTKTKSETAALPETLGQIQPVGDVDFDLSEFV